MKPAEPFRKSASAYAAAPDARTGLADSVECTEDTFSYGPARVTCFKYGGGEKVMLAFHGFGQQAWHIAVPARQFKQHYTVYSFQLFFHGGSLWQAKEVPVSTDFWADFMKQWLQREGIERFSLTGFSMGCKFVLATLHALPRQTERVILMAPDGLAPNLLYKFAVGSKQMRGFLKQLIFKPRTFFAIVSTLRTLHLVNQTLLKFAASQMNTREKRWRVYNSWVCFRHLYFSPAATAELLNRHQIAIEILLGKYDKVITRRSITALAAKLQNVHIEVLETGHGNFLEKAARFYADENRKAAATPFLT